MLNESVLVDTGPLIAFYNDDDAHHAACKEQMSVLAVGKAYTCWPVIVEAAYMLRGRLEQRDDLLESVGNGSLPLFRLRAGDIGPVRAILTKYHDQGIDLADACLLHLADRSCTWLTARISAQF
jgi:predicted nucleic acid-binding protein